MLEKQKKGNSESGVFKELRRYKLIEQKAFYFGEGAEMYYNNGLQKKKHISALQEKYVPFITKYISKEKKTLFVNLGCGNSLIEKCIFEDLFELGYNFSLLGVDSSEEMIHLSRENLKDVSFDHDFLCMDFTDDKLKDVLEEKNKDYDEMLISFVGGSTFGNIDSNYIADILLDFLKSGEKLWIQVVISEDNSQKTAKMLFDRYLPYLDFRGDFYFHPLKSFGLEKDSGELFLKFEKEDATGTMRFRFCFRSLEKRALFFEGKTMTLLPETEIELMNIRIFVPEGIKKIFEERDFTFLDKDTINLKTGQFLFEKK